MFFFFSGKWWETIKFVTYLDPYGRAQVGPSSCCSKTGGFDCASAVIGMGVRQIYVSKDGDESWYNGRYTTIFTGKTHYKWPFSIAMLDYQRVIIFFEHQWRSNFWVRMRIPRLADSLLTPQRPIESWKVFQKVLNRGCRVKIQEESQMSHGWEHDEKLWNSGYPGYPGYPIFGQTHIGVESRTCRFPILRLPPIQRMFVWSVSEVPPTMSPHNVMLTGQWPFHHFLVWSFCSGRFFQLTQSSDFTRISYFETGNTPVVIDEIPVMSELYPHILNWTHSDTGKSRPTILEVPWTSLNLKPNAIPALHNPQLFTARINPQLNW